MHLIGKILWWDKRDKNGVIVDPFGNEFYFDISVIQGRKTDRVSAGTYVRFRMNEEIEHSSCAKAVILPPTRERDLIRSQFAQIRQSEAVA